MCSMNMFLPVAGFLPSHERKLTNVLRDCMIVSLTLCTRQRRVCIDLHANAMAQTVRAVGMPGCHSLVRVQAIGSLCLDPVLCCL